MQKNLSTKQGAKTTKDAQKVATRKQGHGVKSFPHAPSLFTAEEAQAVRDSEYTQAWAALMYALGIAPSMALSSTEIPLQAKRCRGKRLGKAINQDAPKMPQHGEGDIA